MNEPKLRSLQKHLGLQIRVILNTKQTVNTAHRTRQERSFRVGSCNCNGEFIWSMDGEGVSGHSERECLVWSKLRLAGWLTFIHLSRLIIFLVWFIFSWGCWNYIASVYWFDNIIRSLWSITDNTPKWGGGIFGLILMYEWAHDVIYLCNYTYHLTPTSSREGVSSLYTTCLLRATKVRIAIAVSSFGGLGRECQVVVTASGWPAFHHLSLADGIFGLRCVGQ